MAKPKLIATPRGTVAGFCAIQSPTWDFNKTQKEYQIKVAFDADDPEMEKFIAEMEALRDAHLEEVLKEKPKYKKIAKTKEVGEVELDDDGDPTGRILIRFKQKYEIVPKKGDPFTKTIALVDSRGKPITKKLKIGNGSVVRVSFEPSPYFIEKDKEAGMSFGRLAGVKLIKFVEYTGGASADDMGFGGDESEDGGFDASDFTGGDDDQTSGGEGGDAPGEDDF